MSIEANKARSRRLYEEVIGRGDLDVADEIVAPDCVMHRAGSPPVVGTGSMKRHALVLRTAFPDLLASCADQVAESDRVVSRWINTGTFSGPFPGAQPTGAPVRFEEIRIDRFADGRIVESWYIPDRMTLWQQIGLLPVPGTGGASR